MARRLLLVPEDMYKGLLTSATVNKTHVPKEIDHDLPESTRLDVAATEVNKQINRKKKNRKKTLTKKRSKLTSKNRKQRLTASNISTRKVLYDQALRRYLRLREEAKNRPVKVELTPKGTQVLIKKGVQTPGGSPIVKAAVLNEDGEISDDFMPKGFARRRRKTDESFITSDGENIPPSQEKFKTPEFARRGRNNFITSDGEDFSPSREQFRTPQFTRTGRHLYIAERLRLSEEFKKAKLQKLKDFIMANKHVFPVTDDGLYIKKTVNSIYRIRGSNLKDTLERLIEPGVHNAPSPPGTNSIKKLLNATKYASFLHQKPYRNKPFISPSDYDPNLASTSHQTGKGKKKCCSKLNNFRPSIWKKRNC